MYGDNNGAGAWSVDQPHMRQWLHEMAREMNQRHGIGTHWVERIAIEKVEDE